MNFIERPKYLDLLKRWQVSLDLVKIITGTRRSGKSTLFTLFQNDLLRSGIREDQIINIHLENQVLTKKIGLKFNPKTKLLDEFDLLLDFIMKAAPKNKRFYIFLDEIQLLDNWQRLANTLRLQNHFDVYLTGSNAHMFSSDLANTFGGRYIEIKIQPLSFKEFFWGRIDNPNIKSDPIAMQVATLKLYNEYLAQSGFPQVRDFNGDQELIKNYLLDSVYRNTVQKDIIQRFNVNDSFRLDMIIKFLFNNISRETSLLNIQRKLKSEKIDISPTTLNNYIKGLLDSYLIYRCDRYDLKGKRILESLAKYYVVDLGLREALTSEHDTDRGHILENIVYLELLRRGYEPKTGKIKRKSVKANQKTESKTIEVDFVATGAGGVIKYYQVAWTALNNDDVFIREMASLEAIKDNHPKYLLTMDYGSGETRGIKRINVLDWLMNDDES